jgi:hypothetical protein
MLGAMKHEHISDHFEQLLGLGDEWRVAQVEFDHEKREVGIRVELREGGALRCPACKASCPGYDKRERSWRHLARAAHRAFGRRGAVLFGRYGLTLLRSPRQVRAALAYTLLNSRKHWRELRGRVPPVRLDEASSGRWFDGWRRAPPRVRPLQGPREVAPPRSWLLTTGWRRHGLVDPAEVPGRG